MAAMTCEDCGQAHEARRDAKVCSSCRLFRNIMYCVGKWKRDKKCRACGTRFRPIHARDLSYCADCELAVARRPNDATTCVFCKQDRPAAQKGVPACLYCAKDPAGQARVLRALRGGRETRTAAHA